MRMIHHIKPKALCKGDTIGIFTPSFPAHVLWREKYLFGLSYLQSQGFQILEGTLTSKGTSEGYRTGSPQDRACEFMEFIENKNVTAIIATIGGYNSSSLIPYLDFKVIRNNPKIICGLSDITTLHCAILKYSGLITYYGPNLMNLIDYPAPDSYTSENFFNSLMDNSNFNRKVFPPKKWSNHLLDASTEEWKITQRKYKENAGWKALRQGKVTAPILCMNLNTLLSAAGTSYFPDIEDRILMLEDMDAPLDRTERSLMHLELMGVFDKICGLVFGKIEFPDKNADENNIAYEKIILEVIGNRRFPIITNFDCSHTMPMLTIAQETIVTFNVQSDYSVDFWIGESMVS
jgi:muramoyltetrapeptide carboxypeptidase